MYFLKNATESIAIAKKMNIDRHNQGFDDGGSTRLWNVGLLQRDYTALYII
jgi:hypothetical protein